VWSARHTKTRMLSATWSQVYLLSGQGLGITAIIAALPVVTLLLLLGVLRKPAWMAGLAGLAVTFIVTIGFYGMPGGLALSAAGYGAAFGLFPISWIVYWAIVLYRVTVETGKFSIIKDSVGHLTTDSRLQALLIAFAFGAFVEGAAGFGTPVAVAAAMLTGLGMTPFAASAACLLANTAPVAFGSIGIPVITLAGITGLPLAHVSAAVGHLCAPVSFFIPAYLTVAMGGRRSLKAVWPAAFLAGGSFALVQFLVSNYVAAQLTDILSSLTAIGALIILLRVWKPVDAPPANAIGAGAGSSGAAVQPAPSARRSPREIAYAWMPYGLLVVFVLLWGYKPVQAMLNTVTSAVPWPHLHNLVQRMPPVVTKSSAYPAIFTLNWLSASGSACMFATLLSAVFLGMKPIAFIRLLGSVARQLFLPTVTVTSVLALAFLMNYSGATGTLGLAFASTGVVFPFFSAILGWLGVFLTGSDTSANALFGSLQVVTAHKLGLSPALMAAGNSTGGVMGKMISLQTIAVAAAATGMSVADQARLFRFTLKHSILLAAVVGLIVMFYAYVVPIRF
jgi:L-lactate transport